MKKFVIVDDKGHPIMTCYDRKDADMVIADNAHLKLEIAEENEEDPNPKAVA